MGLSQRTGGEGAREGKGRVEEGKSEQEEEVGEGSRKLDARDE